MKPSGPIKRKKALKRSTTPIRKVNPTAKAKRVAKQKAFYSSAAWRKLRKEALERAGNQCEFILETTLTMGGPPYEIENNYRCPMTINLHVHHIRNSHFGGQERLRDLVVLCKDHHMRHHALEGKRIR